MLHPAARTRSRTKAWRMLPPPRVVHVRAPRQRTDLRRARRPLRAPCSPTGRRREGGLRPREAALRARDDYDHLRDYSRAARCPSSSSASPGTAANCSLRTGAGSTNRRATSPTRVTRRSRNSDAAGRSRASSTAAIATANQTACQKLLRRRSRRRPALMDDPWWANVITVEPRRQARRARARTSLRQTLQPLLPELCRTELITSPTTGPDRLDHHATNVFPLLTSAEASLRDRLGRPVRLAHVSQDARVDLRRDLPPTSRSCS